MSLTYRWWVTLTNIQEISDQEIFYNDFLGFRTFLHMYTKRKYVLQITRQISEIILAYLATILPSSVFSALWVATVWSTYVSCDFSIVQENTNSISIRLALNSKEGEAEYLHAPIPLNLHQQPKAIETQKEQAPPVNLCAHLVWIRNKP